MYTATSEGYKSFKHVQNVTGKDSLSNNGSEKQGLLLMNFTKYGQSYKSFILHYIDKLNVTAKQKQFMKTKLNYGLADAKEIMQTLAFKSKNKTIEIMNREFQQRLPGGILIGCKKCGTGFFARVLWKHSVMAIRRPFEVHFFDKYERYPNPSYRHYESYRLKMKCSFPDQLTMEKTPRYWVTGSAPKEIHNMNPNIKLVLLVREPPVGWYQIITTQLPDARDVLTYQSTCLI